MFGWKKKRNSENEERGSGSSLPDKAAVNY